MFEHAEKVVLAGKEYPIRCDINVLAEIQDQFDTIPNFEMLLTGVKIRKDKDGNALLDHDNKILFDRCDPSVRAIAAILPCMLREACGGGDLSEALDAVANARFDLYGTALQMHKELDKCFERKNV
ncbi:MAG: hypothetical protein K1W30_13875 [Lachnospiraceae bacterium]